MILVEHGLCSFTPTTRDRAERLVSRAWLERTLSGAEFVRFAWLSPWAFIRISTNARVFEHPLSFDEADDIVSSCLAPQPTAGVVEPGERRWDILRGLAREAQVTGPLVIDIVAVLAARAVEHGATLCATDRDFARFPGVVWTNPIAERAG